MGVSVRQLEVFRLVVRTGTVSGAARLLHISQPAVTRTLHVLEEELQLSLFRRIRGRLQVTPEAQALLPQVERMFGQVETIQQLSAELRDGYAGTLNIASVASLSSTIVPVAISRFCADRPRVRVDLRAMSTRQVIDSVTNNQVDLGVIDVPEAGIDAEVTEICRASLVCVSRGDHRLAGLKQVGVADLKGERLITYAEDTQTGWAVREALRKLRGPSPIVITVNQTFSAYALAETGSGVALVDPFPMLTGVFPGLVARPFRPAIHSQPRALVGRARPASIITQEFVQTLVGAANEFLRRSKYAA